MTTISFSVEEEIARDFAAMAKKRGLSKSDMFRTMFKRQSFDVWLNDFQDAMEPKLREMGIETEEELEAYLESDETYEDRIRHQRLRAAGN